MGKRNKDKPKLVDATILFIDLMSSVSLSTSLSLFEYNQLITDFQAVLHQVIEVIKPRYNVAEHYVGGDQLAMFFYDSEDAGKREKIFKLQERNPDSPKALQLETELIMQANRRLYGALRCAVQVKNAWVSHPRNVARIDSHQPVLDLGVGINTGPVVLQQRSDGTPRIEGFAINFAKRVEGFSRYGQYCKIMLSKTAHETFSKTVVAYLMLKQRAFFKMYTPQTGQLKGLAPGTQVHELKFFHRLDGFSIPAEHVPVFTRIFKLDPTNIWAYTNLINFHLYENENLDTAMEIAQHALYCNQQNEKICFDLAKLNYFRQEHVLAKEYALMSIGLNPEMDIAFDLLADIEMKQEGNLNRAVEYRARAVALSPDSSQNHIDMAMALARQGSLKEATRHYLRSKQLYSKITDLNPNYVKELEELLYN